MLMDISLVTEPQHCFRIGSFTYCNWVHRGINQALKKDDGGYLRFPARHKKSKSEEKEISVINQKEKALTAK